MHCVNKNSSFKSNGCCCCYHHHQTDRVQCYLQNWPLQPLQQRKWQQLVRDLWKLSWLHSWASNVECLDRLTKILIETATKRLVFQSKHRICFYHAHYPLSGRDAILKTHSKEALNLSGLWIHQLNMPILLTLTVMRCLGTKCLMCEEWFDPWNPD